MYFVDFLLLYVKVSFFPVFIIFGYHETNNKQGNGMAILVIIT